VLFKRKRRRSKDQVFCNRRCFKSTVTNEVFDVAVSMGTGYYGEKLLGTIAFAYNRFIQA